MLGALCHYLSRADAATFQPMKANFGLMPSLDHPPKGKRQRAQAYSSRALDTMAEMWKAEYINKVFDK